MSKLCKDCGERSKAPARSRCWPCYHQHRKFQHQPVNPGAMRILFLDIETRPAQAYTWGIWNVNIGVNQIIEPGGVMCFAAKWLGEDTVEFAADWLMSHEAMLSRVWNLLDEADVVVHYYGSKFDIPHLNREFLQAGFMPPSPYKQVDLKTVAAKQFKFISNKLQFVSEALGLAGKVEHEGFPLWTKVMGGDIDAQIRMQEYNIQDTKLLEEVYEIMLPWIPNVPHGHLYNGEDMCPACGIAEPLVHDGLYYTKLSVFGKYHCNNCGSWFRSSKRLYGVKMQEAVL